MFESLQSGWWFAGGAAILTVLATCWSHLQAIYQQLASRIVVTVTCSGYQAEAILIHLKTNFSASKWGQRSYLGWMLYVQPQHRVQLVPMEATPSTGKLYWRGWLPIWTFKPKGESADMDEGVTARDYRAESISLMFLRGTFDPDQLMIDATNSFNKDLHLETEGRRHYIRFVHGTAGKMLSGGGSGESSGRTPSSNSDVRGCMKHRSLQWSLAELGPEQNGDGSAYDRLALPDEALEMIREARHWRESESWYKERGIPWRRGWMLYGQPGTGKTALARAVAEDLDLPVYVYDLASLYNNELQQQWSRMLSEVPCMALIEDIDAVFNQRENVSGRDRQHLTFDCFLNCLDGIERADGLFVVMSTNRIERVDAALGLPTAGSGSTRPGRIDRVIELPVLDEAGRRKIASRILREWPNCWAETIEAGVGDTGAQFQERCARRALELHYDGGKTASSKPARSTAGSHLEHELLLK